MHSTVVIDGSAMFFEPFFLLRVCLLLSLDMAVLCAGDAV